MASTRLLLLLAPFYLVYDGTLCDARIAPTAKGRNQDNGLGVSGRVLFHDYRFQRSSTLASQLVSTTFHFNVQLGSLIHGYVGDTRYKDEVRKDECFRRVFELPWFPTIKPNLTAHLTGVLTNLIEKDADLAERAVAKCGRSNKECVEHLTRLAEIEITSFGQTELNNVVHIKEEYLHNIRYELMDRCLQSN